MLSQLLKVLMLLPCLAAATEFHVAPAGDDANPGSAAAPFATLMRARDALRSLPAAEKDASDHTVWIHGGDYLFSSSFALSPEDSGTAERRIVYRTMPGEAVHLAGALHLPADAFRPLPDDRRSHVQEAAWAQVMVADLSALGPDTLGNYPPQFTDPPVVPELFFNDQRMTLARWPNEGWAEVARVVESGPAPWRNHESTASTGTFEYSGDRPSLWKTAGEVWLQGYWCFDWANEFIKIARVDEAKHEITLAGPHVYGLGSGNPAPRRYRAFNLLEELDAPGEYFIDRAQRQLYFWPPTDMSGARIALSILAAPLLETKEVSHVTFQGLTLETAQGRAIQIAGGEDVTLAACTVRNTGQEGVVVDGGHAHRVVACDIYDTGTDGLRISGGDRKTLEPSRHEVINNHLYNISRRRPTAAYHVQLAGVGIRFAHNKLHDAPHQSILLSGNDHIVEYNEVYDISRDSDDCGAFYMGRNPSERGNVIRYNYWHDIGSDFAHGSCAVYFDDGTSGQRVYGNIFYKASGGSFGAVFNHGGHDNWVENNIFIESSRAVGHAPWDAAGWKTWVEGELWQTKLLQEVDITKPPYTERYPELRNFFDLPEPRNNYLRRNIIYRCKEAVSGNWIMNDNWVTREDPGFVDAAAQQWQLKPDAAVFRILPGFEQIPFAQIGLYEDALRPTLPAE